MSLLCKLCVHMSFLYLGQLLQVEFLGCVLSTRLIWKEPIPFVFSPAGSVGSGFFMCVPMLRAAGLFYFHHLVGLE
jgi:hypothetical protein